jgi:hypothetical protein
MKAVFLLILNVAVGAIPWTSKSKWLIVEVARMFGTLRRHPLLVLNQAARDPLDTLAALQDNLHSRIESTNTIGYIADPDWESARHRRLGMSSESVGQGFWPLWSTVVELDCTLGLAIGGVISVGKPSLGNSDAWRRFDRRAVLTALAAHGSLHAMIQSQAKNIAVARERSDGETCCGNTPVQRYRISRNARQSALPYPTVSLPTGCGDWQE